MTNQFDSSLQAGMFSHITATFVTVASCVCVPWFFGYWSPHASSEAQVISLLERQLQRCGPENQTCAPCLAHSHCSWSTITATGFLGFIGGFLAAATAGSVYLLFSVRRPPFALTREWPQGSFYLPSSPSSRDSSKSSVEGTQRRRLRPTLPLAILSADQVREL